ncbi:Hydrogen peroxide-inducible genes activator [Roseovarius albus]|uniref:Hydrogen peroxide-inducible genes activator n=1 Tax=Roseovarius albus TaxID=1247867 RepID=A0A1X7A3M6_9RHOB|nr:LysR family transcriptional regulator [Roseovarius albus]SLN69223.1 Hydrogen peroxide-inducible genes activator [Roseovarius albus]
MLYITLRQYEYILAVADTGSLTDAAGVLNVSQPSLSVAISRVEDHIGRKIFLRGKGSAISITPFGHRFVEQAQALLHSAAVIEHASDATRPYVLGCFEDIAPWYLPNTLKRLRNTYPTHEFNGIEARFADLASGMLRGEIDFAITYDVGFDDRFQRRHLKEITPVAFVAMGHPLASHKSLDLREVAKYPLILSAEGLSESHMRTLFDTLNITAKLAHKAASLELMRSMAAHGEGVGISYSFPTTPTSYDGQPLVTIPITTPKASAGLYIIWPAPDQPNPLLDQFTASIKSK